MTAPAPRALVFDWDNTLVDTWPVIGACLNATLAAFGLPTWSDDEVQARVRASARDSFPRLFGDRAEEAMAYYYETFEARHLERLAPLPGTQERLESLAASGRYLAVVSNKRGDLLRREAVALGWQGLFGALVGATDTARDKPDPAPVEAALAPAGLAASPEAVWFVGDADIDLVCARRARCLPVLLRAQAPAPGEFPEEAAPARHFADLGSLWRDLAETGAAV